MKKKKITEYEDFSIGDYVRQTKRHGEAGRIRGFFSTEKNGMNAVIVLENSEAIPWPVNMIRHAAKKVKKEKKK